MPAYRIIDEIRLDLTGVKEDLRAKFIKDSAIQAPGVKVAPPVLVVTVAATHAGMMTRNKGFYRPDVMKTYIDSFTKPFPKPVQLHHEDRLDPIGRVRAARYVDTSYRYADPIKEFKNKFTGTTFLDAKAKTSETFDQVKWILKNLNPVKGYDGLGYGELDLFINDKHAAEKILDERYLTVSVGFTTTEVYCSECKQDWAGGDGPCEHQPGEMYDSAPMVLVPANFSYEEVSWVNSPADPHAKSLKVIQTSIPEQETVSMPMANSSDFTVTPILHGVGHTGIYRLDAYKDVATARAQEILNVAKTKDATQEKPAEPELVEADGSKFPKDSETLLKDAKHINYITDAVKAGEIPAHKHRAIMDPATGNGWTDYVAGHSHEVFNEVVQESGSWKYDKDTGAGEKVDVHTHKLDKKVEPLKDSKKDGYTPAGEGTGGSPKKMKKARKKKMADEPDLTTGTTGKPTSTAQAGDATEIKEFEEGATLPEDFEWVADEEAKKDSKVEDNWDSETFYDEVLAPIFTELGFTDAPLTAAQRKGLSSSTFCGPGRSFPVPDCKHVAVAKTYLGRYKGPGNKSTILACVNRKAKALGCSSSKKDSVEPIDLPLVDPAGKEKDVKVRIGSADDIKQVVKTMTPEVLAANRDELLKAATIFGITTEMFDAFLTPDPAVPLDAATAKLEAEWATKVDEKFIESLITAIKALAEEPRHAVVAKLIDMLQAEKLVPKYDDEYNELVAQNQELQDKISRLVSANKDLYKERQSFLATTIVQLKMHLKKADFEKLDDKTRTQKIEELKVRSIDSLNDTLNDLLTEITGIKAPKPTLDEATVKPGSLGLTEPEKQNRTGKKEPKVWDVNEIKGMDDSTFALTRTLHEAFERDTKSQN